MHAQILCNICIYLVLYILVSYVCIMLEWNLIRRTYISSVEFIYEKLIETKKNWIEKKPWNENERNGKKRKPLVSVGNVNQD
jgi:hypothetical protein